MPEKAAAKVPKVEAPKAKPAAKAPKVEVLSKPSTPKPSTPKPVAKVEVNKDEDADDEKDEMGKDYNMKKLEYYNIKFKEYQAKLAAISDKIEYYKSMIE